MNDEAEGIESRRLYLPILSILLVFALIHTQSILSTASSVPLVEPKHESRLSKVVLLHMYDGVSFFRRLGHLTGSNKARYAARHGYDIVFSTPERTSGVLTVTECPPRSPNGSVPSGSVEGPDESGHCWREDSSFKIDPKRAPTFGKIKLTLAACMGRDEAWIFWSDADAMVINHTIPLESIIDDAYDIIFSYDWLMLNAGMLLIKCSEWALNFLQAVYDARKFDEARALDQSAFQEFFDNLTKTERDAHVKVLPKHSMNVYTEEYRPGDFLVHFAGKLYEATEPGLLAIVNQFDILSMTDDVEDIKAFFRGRYFLSYYSGTCPVKKGEKQKDCKPKDPRRMTLKEPLGSMSSPNRYRHVGLRYYWLGDWKDKYDVEGWQSFTKPLTALPRTDQHKQVQHSNYNGKTILTAGNRNSGGKEDQHKPHEQHNNYNGKTIVVTEHSDSDGKKDQHKQQGRHSDYNGQTIAATRHSDSGNKKERSPHLWIFLFGGAITGSGLYILMTRRRKVSSKTH